MTISVSKVVAVLATLISLSAFNILPSSALEISNHLAVGKDAQTSSEVPLSIHSPIDFDYKTRSDIAALRSREVYKYPLLLKGRYSMNGPVWDQIEDKKPWWGTAGAALFDAGSRSMEGPSEESRFVMNPYLLVGANPGTLFIWNAARFTKQEIENPEFPYFWKPESLKINPPKAIGTVTYNLSNYQKEISSFPRLLANNQMVTQFSLVAYNARDFGYKYIYFSPQKSINVLNDNDPGNAVFIKQFIHCGGTCGYAGGCNNMSPFTAEIDRLRVTRLPARATCFLWKEAPASVEQEPDMTFLLEFK